MCVVQCWNNLKIIAYLMMFKNLRRDMLSACLRGASHCVPLEACLMKNSTKESEILDALISGIMNLDE